MLGGRRCLRPRPSGLAFRLSAPPPPHSSAPLSNANGAGACWSPSPAFLEERSFSRAAFVKSSSGRIVPHGWIIFVSAAAAQPLLFVSVDAEPLAGSTPPSQSAVVQSKQARPRPSRTCLSRKDKDDQKPRALPGNARRRTPTAQRIALA